MQENAALRDAIAAAQQQLHEAAAAAASRVLAEKALEGEQQARQALEQAHTLVRAFIYIPSMPMNLPSVCAQCLGFACAQCSAHLLQLLICLSTVNFATDFCPFHERSPACGGATSRLGVIIPAPEPMRHVPGSELTLLAEQNELGSCSKCHTTQNHLKQNGLACLLVVLVDCRRFRRHRPSKQFKNRRMRFWPNSCRSVA